MTSVLGTTDPKLRWTENLEVTGVVRRECCAMMWNSRKKKGVMIELVVVVMTQ